MDATMDRTMKCADETLVNKRCKAQELVDEFNKAKQKIKEKGEKPSRAHFLKFLLHIFEIRVDKFEREEIEKAFGNNLRNETPKIGILEILKLRLIDFKGDILQFLSFLQQLDFSIDIGEVQQGGGTEDKKSYIIVTDFYNNPNDYTLKLVYSKGVWSVLAEA